MRKNKPNPHSPRPLTPRPSGPQRRFAPIGGPHASERLTRFPRSAWHPRRNPQTS